MVIELSTEEESLLQQLQREHRSWHFIRWLFVFGGVAASLCGLVVRSQLVAALNGYMAAFPDVTNTSLLIAGATTRGVTTSWLLFGGGLVAAGFAIGRWRGNPTTRLLMSILGRSPNSASVTPAPPT
jgi:hypothetical protein